VNGEFSESASAQNLPINTGKYVDISEYRVQDDDLSIDDRESQEETQLQFAIHRSEPEQSDEPDLNTSASSGQDDPVPSYSMEKDTTEEDGTVYMKNPVSSDQPAEAEEEEKVLALAATGDKEAKKRLVEGSLAKVAQMVKEYEGRELPMSDVVQEANVALTAAAAAYDGSQQWQEFLAQEIRQAVEAAPDCIPGDGKRAGKRSNCGRTG